MDSPYGRQVLVCTYGPWCRLDGSDPVRDKLKKLVKDAGLAKEVRVTKSGCLGQCGHGPVIACWPENVWYAGVKAEDAQDLFETQIVRGEPLERLRYRAAKPGGNKTAAVLAKEAETGKVAE